ncbi:MAG: helix-turn-helix transcriptional regulator [Clostridia bacterium]|nr:helix-turn-helix transcriptional regulator [Clostridia bacterium]
MGYKVLIGDNVKLLRNIRVLTQKDLAELVDVAPGTLAHIEKGTCNPSLELLYKLADALSVSVINLVLSLDKM